jgi:hypothetical protein
VGHSIPQKYITFAKDNLACLAGYQASENLVKVKLFGFEQSPITSNNFAFDVIILACLIL